VHTAAYYYSVAAGAAICSLYAAYRFLSSASRNRIFADTPVVRIRSAAQGYVHVQGRATPPPGDPTMAPLSGTPCVWWDYQIERREKTSEGKTSWGTIDQGTSVAPFVLSEGDAHCLVGPVGAEITPTAKDVWYGDTARPLGGPPALRRQIISDRDYRYTERLIGVGAQLSVLGELRSDSAVSEIDQQAAALLARWKSDQQSLLQRFDRNHDGRIDQDEWTAARAAARTEVQTGGQGSSLDRISVVGQTTHGAPFVITPLDARQLVNREKLRTAVAMVVSVLALFVTVWAIGEGVHLPRHLE
jgi:E3 Ubiquitin ligase